jgi:hypothetical protein
MATQEFHIRNETDSDGRGPDHLEQVASLSEAVQSTSATLIYDAANELWVALSAQAELMASLSPEKKKFILQARGLTDDTADKRDPAIAMMRAARVGLWSCLGALVAGAAGAMLPHPDAVLSLEPAKFFAQPIMPRGLLDVFVAVMLGFGMVSLYPFVRFRAALGIGFLGFMFVAHRQPLPALLMASGSTGLCLCTLFVLMLPMVIVAGAAVGGMGSLTGDLLSL